MSKQANRIGKVAVGAFVDESTRTAFKAAVATNRTTIQYVIEDAIRREIDQATVEIVDWEPEVDVLARKYAPTNPGKLAVAIQRTIEAFNPRSK